MCHPEVDRDGADIVVGAQDLLFSACHVGDASAQGNDLVIEGPAIRKLEGCLCRWHRSWVNNSTLTRHCVCFASFSWQDEHDQRTLWYDSCDSVDH